MLVLSLIRNTSIYSSSKKEFRKPSFPRRQESTAAQPMRADSRLRGNDEQWHFLPETGINQRFPRFFPREGF